MAHKLILHARGPDQAPRDLGRLTRMLGEIGFTGRAFRLGDAIHYLPGEHFLQLVIFLGCSPSVALEPPEGDATGAGGEFCHVALEAGVSPAARFIAGRHVPAPRCPRCRTLAEGVSGARRAAGQTWGCPGCRSRFPLWALDWRGYAGFTRFCIEVWGVHPFEAVPSDQLLQALREESAGDWGFFYLSGV